MAYQEHLTRQIEQLGVVLRRLLSAAVGIEGRAEPRAGVDAVERDLIEALHLQVDELRKADAETLLRQLQHLGAATEANQDLLADLLIALAERSANASRRTQLLRQALAILEHVNATSNTFDMERHGRIDRLRGLV